MKIRILTQNPFSVWFWWVELQALKYIENIKKLDNKIDIWYFKWDEKDFEILHIIWIHTWINPYWIDVLKSKWIKIIVSPVFYIKSNSLFDFRRPIFYKLFSYIPFHIINWMKHSLKKADLIIPNSIEEQNQIINIFWINKNKFDILYNWVDKNYFEWVDNNLFKNKYNFKKYILCVSHIEPRKNHLNLIKAFFKFKEKYKNDLKLVLLWDFRWNYFKYHNEIKNILKNNKNDILHINNLSTKDILFKSTYLWCEAHFLLSSLETPWLSNLEAWLAWKKLILWDCKPVKEYFKNYAKYISWKNIKKIIEEIKKIDKQNYKINDKQVEYIKNNYTWEEIWKKLLEYYKKIWKKK